MGRSPPGDLVCPLCSKPIRSGTLVVYEHGELVHVTCRSRSVERNALDVVDRAQTVQRRSAQLMDKMARRRAARATSDRPVSSTCPLCAYPATLTDWRPGAEWIVVENCPCNGFFVWAPMIERVRALPFRDRHDFARRIRGFRARHEAWLATTDGMVTGPLVIRTQRSDRPT